VLGYTTQARFLFNCGLLELAADAGLREKAALQKLVNEHEMGELFKVIGRIKRWLQEVPAERAHCHGVHGPVSRPAGALGQPGRLEGVRAQCT
jgi:hypothetical protein